jgi:hypothetical protein
MGDLDAICVALAKAPYRPLRATLARCVALAPLTERRTLDYLFTSGQANRFNPPGVRCVYFSEDEGTARTEYARRFGRSAAALQPLSVYFAEVSLTRVLDLGDLSTRQAVSLKAADLSVVWQLARHPIRTQLLGLAVSQQTMFSAIRFPSDATRAAGFSGFNVVIFQDSVQRPDFVRILGPTKKPLQQWP